jgi:hypothetical protein
MAHLCQRERRLLTNINSCLLFSTVYTCSYLTDCPSPREMHSGETCPHYTTMRMSVSLNPSSLLPGDLPTPCFSLTVRLFNPSFSHSQFFPFFLPPVLRLPLAAFLSPYPSIRLHLHFFIYIDISIQTIYTFLSSFLSLSHPLFVISFSIPLIPKLV